MGVFPSGQRGQTVNLLLFSYDGSNPSAPTTGEPPKPVRVSHFVERELLFISLVVVHFLFTVIAVSHFGLSLF